MLRILALASLFVALAAFVTPTTAATAPSKEPTRGAELARQWILVDTHIDVPYRLHDVMEDISKRTPNGDFDAVRAKAGGLDAPFMSIYLPAGLQATPGASRQLADQLIDMVEGLAKKSPALFEVAHSVADVRRIAAAGKIAFPMGMENGSGIENDLQLLEHFHRRGIRYITLTHGKHNAIADSSYDTERPWHGLSPFGRATVAEMNRLGIMVDVSHVSDETFDDVLALSKAPVIASHSSCRHFTPGWERNLDDERIRKLGQSGGVFMVNFGGSFLRDDIRKQWEEVRPKHREWEKSLGRDATAEENKAWFAKAYGGPPIRAQLSDVVAHIRHAVDLAGVDHVGFGSDFDGVGDTLPDGIRDVSQYPNLIDALLASGFSEDDVKKIAGENLLRVWGEVERLAASAR
jgi:membrane dipeptidase